MAEKKTKKQYKFKAEVTQLLDILTHSLYSYRDVFIRELISNATDALDKVRLKKLLGEDICDKELDLEIKIDLNKDNKTFTISDTGIGMTREELKNNIGTIARSGTSDFLKAISAEGQDKANLIGKFGVGFYSVFMAGKKVEITTNSAEKKEPAYIWTSTGQGSFQIAPASGDIKRGTTIKVFLREDAEKFAEKETVQSAIEKYSNFVPFPILLNGEKANKISAIWREPKSSVKEKDYKEFFKFIARQNDDPLTWYHFKADVPLQFNVLLFVPKTNFELMGLSRNESGIKLFVKRVMIDPHAQEILPTYLRFVEGVIESDDLPLNISRETLQENPYMIKIKNTVVSKFLSYLQDFSQKNPDQYREFWNQFGRILKEGYTDYSNKDKISELFRFNSSKCKDKNELIDLKTYVDRMVKDQEEIYFLSGPSREDLENNPTLEIFRKNDIEVLYCYDPVDEFVLPGLFEYKDKKIISADQADLSQIEKLAPEKEKKKEVSSAKRKELEKLTRRMKNILGDKVEDVVLSDRLIDSPAMLAGTNQQMSKQMEKIMQMVNKEATPVPKKMEINKNHPLINKMLTIYNKNAKDALLTKLVNNLYTTTMLLDGNITDTHEMVDNLQILLKETADMYTKSQNKK